MSNPTLTRSPLPSIALVGRANVGKSTLWNKITERTRALVSGKPHTTRDRNIAEASWRGKTFELVDTGGMDVEPGEIGAGIKRQAERAIKEADLVLFMVDGKTGIVPDDRKLAKATRTLNKNVILVVNKIDNPRDMADAADGGIYSLGIGEPTFISASTGKSVGDLLDVVYGKLEDIGRPPLEIEVKEKPKGSRRERREAEDAKKGNPDEIKVLSENPEDADEQKALRLVLLGRPNAGKSSLVNSILGEERVIVSPVAHTTREPQDTSFNYNGRDMVIIDTAGMRKRANVLRGLEEEGLERNKEVLDEADVAFLVFDASEDPTNQDRRLAGLMEASDKGLVLVANKWDLIPEKTTKSTDRYEAVIRQMFPFLVWAPMVFVSAKENLRTRPLLDVALKVQEERNRKIDYNALQRLLKATMKQKRPITNYGPKSPYIYDLAQVRTEPPTFLITIRGDKETVHPSWMKFLEKRIRDKFGFEGTPIVIKATNIPLAKSERDRNVQGPGMEAVAGKITHGWELSKKKNVRWRP